MKTIAWIAIGALGALTVPQDTGVPLRVDRIAANFTLEQLAPTVFAFVSNNTTHTWEDGNAVAIIGNTCVVVVDAPASYLAKRHLAAIQHLTQKPVCFLVNTHSHRDHVLGNYVYKDAFPALSIIQQETAAAISDRVNPAAVEALKGNAAADQRRQLEAAVSAAAANPTSTYNVERANRDLQEAIPVFESARDGRYVPADVTYAEAMTLRLGGGTDVQLLHMVGHTFGDTVLWLPKERILITGDLVIAPVPYGGGTKRYDEWAASLDRLMAFGAVAIVPGHGEVMYDTRYLTEQRDLFQGLMAQAVAAVRAGLTLEAFKKALDLSAFEARFVHNDPELKWAWDNYFIGTGNALAAQAYGRARGDW
jgi:cyclase